MITKKLFGHQPLEDFSIEIPRPWKIPSKKNAYEIHFSPAFWAAISSLASHFKTTLRGRSLYWVAPSKKVVQFERNLSIWFALYLPNYGELPIVVHIKIDQKNDVDNIGGAILDALEKSRKIKNDKQVVAIVIERVEGIEDPIINIKLAQTAGAPGAS